jgi:hypothetical protein
LIQHILREQTKEINLNELSPENRDKVDVIYKDSNLVVVVPKVYEMCKLYSKGTKWCSGGNLNLKEYMYNADEVMRDMFNKWSKDGILFRLLFRGGDKLRLTWELDGGFSWGSGGKEYKEITWHYIGKNPFDLRKLTRMKSYWEEKGIWDEGNEYIWQHLKLIPKGAADTIVEYYKKAKYLKKNAKKGN